MGDRAIIVFAAKGQMAPGVYLHDEGFSADNLIRAAIPHLRRGDAWYSAARFCGCCHAWIDGNVGLGLFRQPTDKDVANNFKNYSHGDAGVFVVCMETGQVSAFAGYGKSFTIDNFEKVCPA